MTTDAARRGRTQLADDAAPEVLAAVAAAEADGCRWVYDPEVHGVVGLVVPGTNRALVVVYADGDWEIADALHETYMTEGSDA
jgi:hypothetical protein